MTANELETSIRYNIPVIALVFNNQSYGTIRMHQEKVYPERVMATDLGHISFVELAKSLGADGKQVRSAAGFSQALEWALAQKKSVVIEIMTDVEQISPRATITDIRQKS
ncbi:Acetolactate synthase [Lentibacillus sp. JNUCC-1]|nr:Acetolactate synthase [Lentibacillus sp. JNUCC-1]